MKHGKSPYTSAVYVGHHVGGIFFLLRDAFSQP